MEKGQETPVSVVNLSNIELTPAQYSLLEKGLSFCPTPGPSGLSTTRADLDRFHGSLKLWAYFNHDNHQSNGTPDQDDLVNLTNPPEEEGCSDKKFAPRSM